MAENASAAFVNAARSYAPKGKLDFFRIHSLTLDRLGDFLTLILPEGSETYDARWLGAHPLRPILVSVSLLSGAWEEPDTGRAGRDLVSLTAYLLGVSQTAAARRLAAWLGASEVRYA